MRVFVTQPVAESALARLRAIADVTVNEDGSRILPKDALIAAVRDADILFALLHDTVDRDVLSANPKLRGVASMTITPDHIDVAAATELGIPVTNIPAVVTEATADLALALMLSVARRVVEGDHLVRKGVFPGSQSNYLAGGYLFGKTLGLVGAGRIGQATARRARGFSMRILYTDPHRLDPEIERELGLEHAPMDELLRHADFISLHPQLSPATRHLIGERELSLMQPHAILINTSRGPVIDEAALGRALKERRIGGAGLDVFEREPQVDPAVLPLSSVVLTPHLGSAVAELREQMAHIVVDNALALIEGRRPPNCINPQVL